MAWMDEFLSKFSYSKYCCHHCYYYFVGKVWNTTEFKYIEPLVLPKSEVWIPDFAMITSENMYDMKLAKGINVNVYSNGAVFFNPKTSFKSTCEFDLTYFPFDSQDVRFKLIN